MDDKVIGNLSHFNSRMVREKLDGDVERITIREVYYDKKGEPRMIGQSVTPAWFSTWEGCARDGMKEILTLMLKACDHPMLDMEDSNVESTIE